MDRNQFQALANDWVRTAKNDIRNKVTQFIAETETTERELAYALGISEAALTQILRGDGNITLDTMAKLLIATGYAVEIKPIGDTPLSTYDNIDGRGVEDMPIPPMGRHMPPPPPYGMPYPPMGRFPYPHRQVVEDIDENDEFEAFPGLRRREQHPAFERPRFVNRPEEDDELRHMHRQTPPPAQSPFDSMERDKMVKIIRDRLWDTEIDTVRATRSELSEFLKDKDARMKAAKMRNQTVEQPRMQNDEEEIHDPSVLELRDKLKNLLKHNPNLKENYKKFMNEIIG